MKRIVMLLISGILLCACAHRELSSKGTQESVVVLPFVTKQEIYRDMKSNWRGDWVYLIQTGRIKNIKNKTGKVELKSLKYNTVIAEVAKFYKKYPYLKFTVLAHTGLAGSAVVNQRISKERADYVAKLLVNAGIPSSKLDVHGLGESKPLVIDKSLDKSHANYRIEIFPKGFYVTSEHVKLLNIKPSILKITVKDVTDDRGLFAVGSFPNHEAGNFATDPDTGIGVVKLMPGEYRIKIGSPSTMSKITTVTIYENENAEIAIKLIGFHPFPQK